MLFWIDRAAASSAFMPPAATETASRVDSLYMFLLVVSLLACVLVIGGFIYFAFKYKRRTETDKTPYITHSNVLEFTWSFIPFVIFMVAFVWGWWVYHDMRTAPSGAMEIHVYGQKWSWEFVYKSGKRLSNEFYVPVNEPVKLIITSKDVLHSVFIPSFRIKQDAVPGMYTSLWFKADKEGIFQMFCTEFCGDQHSAMLAKVHVVSKEKYEDWLRNDPYKGLDLAQIGEKVYQGRCIACHAVTDQKKVGPGFANLLGKIQSFMDGSSVTVDENYIRESILNPNAKVVSGYPQGVMPTFAGQLAEQELTGVIQYLKSLTNQ